MFLCQQGGKKLFQILPTMVRKTRGWGFEQRDHTSSNKFTS